MSSLFPSHTRSASGSEFLACRPRVVTTRRQRVQLPISMRLVLLVGALVAADPLPAQTIRQVPADYPTIQLAIDVASNGDWVVVAPGTYTENIRFLGKAITLVSTMGAEETVIDGSALTLSLVQGSTVNFIDGEGEDSVLQGFTITGGTGSSDAIPWGGGGILCRGSSPTVSECVVTGNTTASYGGGILIALSGGLAHFEDCTITENSASAGGGIAVRGGNLEVTGCAISGNSAYITGGGVDVAESIVGPPSPGISLTMHTCVIEGNDLPVAGGGLYLDGVNGTIEDSTFCGNQASMLGGVLALVSSDLMVRRCTFSANSAGFGAVVSYSSDSLLLERCAFLGNEAGVEGGALDTGLASGIVADVLVDHCTFYDNSVTTVGGSMMRASSGQGYSISNSIIWQCQFPLFFDEVGGSHDVAFSLVEGGHPGPGNIDADPLFVDAASGDIHLQSDSPCIDAGDPTYSFDEDDTRSDMGVYPFLSPTFIRCDANQDGTHDISDAAALLLALFIPGGEPLPCADAGDGNDDGLLDISDVVLGLSVLFVLGTPPAPDPYETCGEDPTDDDLDCADASGCL